MGDGEEATGAEQPVASYDQPSADQYQSTADQYAATTSQAGDGTTAAQGADTLGEALFDQLGQMYSNGQYFDAIAKVQPLVDHGDPSNPMWGRAAYGLVMCYDLTNQFDQAYSLLQKIMTNHGTHEASEWQQQLQTYQNHHNYSGPPLLY